MRLGDEMNGMKVLVLGCGGREVSLAWKIGCSDLVSCVWIASNDKDIMQHSYCKYVCLDVNNDMDILDFVTAEKIDLVVIGPEAPLEAGVSDSLRSRGVLVFGPSKAAARLETSKHFARQVCCEAGVLVAGFEFFTCIEQAKEYLDSSKAKYPCVVKWDGLAAGKGVVICDDREHAIQAIHDMFNKFATASLDQNNREGVLIEEYIPGREISYFVFTDGRNIVPLGCASDYKRIGEGNTGGNTGGMGAISYPDMITSEHARSVCEKIITPCIRRMAERGEEYKGVLYAGLMISDNGDYLIEFNARFGDPECQALMMRMQSDIVPILMGCAGGEGYSLNDCDITLSGSYSMNVVLASAGYPNSYKTGIPINYPDVTELYDDRDSVKLFYAGVKNKNGVPVTSGGRVLNVCVVGNSLSQAMEKAYYLVDMIAFEGKTFRKDIGM